MNYATFSGLFQSVHDFAQQPIQVQQSQEDLKNDKDNLSMTSLLTVNNMQPIPEGIQRSLQNLSVSNVQTVNSANYLVSSSVISQGQLSFNGSNQLAPMQYIPTTLNGNELQTPWTDTNASRSSSNMVHAVNEHLKNPLPIPMFSTLPPNSLNLNTQTPTWPMKTVTVDSVGTMTDSLLSPDLHELKPKREIDYDNRDCSNINLNIQSSALSQYLSRMPPQVLPSSVQHFLKKYNVPYNVKLPNNNLLSEEVSAIGMGSVNITVCKNKKSQSANLKGTKPTLTTGLDGSVLYGCRECDLKFPDQAALHNHVLSSGHDAIRKFRCDICGICLKRKEHLEQHKRGHSRERPFVCTICWKGFKRSEHLKRHHSIHLDKKCFSCSICGKAFHRKDHLVKHELTHLNRRQTDGYDCTIIPSDVNEGLNESNDIHGNLEPKVDPLLPSEKLNLT